MRRMTRPKPGGLAVFLRVLSRRRVRRVGRPDRLTGVLGVMALVVGTLAVGLPEPARAAVTIPAGFIEGTVADVSAPTDLAFLPDGRMLVSSKPGVLRMIKNDVVVPTPVVDLSAKVCSRREEGLGAVAVDPAYSTNHFVYLFYTFNRVGTCYTYDDGSIVLTKGPVNRLSPSG